MVSASKYIQLAVNRLHEEEEGDPDNLTENIVHIRVQQWTVFDDFAHAENMSWWMRFTEGRHGVGHDADPPSMEDRGRVR